LEIADAHKTKYYILITKMKLDFFKEKKGFTILETIVALGIFSVIIALTTNGFIRALRTQSQASSFAYVNDNLSTVIEQMTREVRTGSDICFNTTTCPNNSTLSFVNAAGQTVTYCSMNNEIERVVGSKCSVGNEITGSRVYISYLRFIIATNGTGDGYPPRVTILIGARPNDQASSMFNVNMQTTVSSRIIGS